MCSTQGTKQNDGQYLFPQEDCFSSSQHLQCSHIHPSVWRSKIPQKLCGRSSPVGRATGAEELFEGVVDVIEGRSIHFRGKEGQTVRHDRVGSWRYTTHANPPMHARIHTHASWNGMEWKYFWEHIHPHTQINTTNHKFKRSPPSTTDIA